jgi:CubicO group peptidase (beta-lactamase class C family)
MSVRANRLFVLALLLGVAACAEEQADPRLVAAANPSTAADGGARADAGGSAPGRGMDGGAPTFATFDKAVNDFIASYNKSDAGAAAPIKGATAVVLDKSKVLHQKAYGEHELDRNYLIASASKILSVGVIMKLADEQKLDINEPIKTYLPEWGDTPVGEVTAAQLFSNSSGMPSLAEVSAAARDLSGPLASNLCQYAPDGDLQTCGQVLYKTEPPREPNSEFAYGGSQWQLGGALAEVVSEKSWAELIDETYVKPCKVPSLGYTNQFAKWSLGYPPAAEFDGDVSKLPETQNPSIEGGAYINIVDYAKLLQMHLNGGKCGNERVLSPEAVKTMQEDWVAKYEGDTKNPRLPGYGLGWWVNEQDGFVADPGAYGAFPWIDNERGYAAMVIIEVSSAVGAQLAFSTKPILDAMFDAKK